MSADIALDVATGRIALTTAQRRALIDAHNQNPAGRRPHPSTTKVLKTLRLVQVGGRLGEVLSTAGEHVARELAAREGARSEYLPEIVWNDGRGWIMVEGNRFEITVLELGSYRLDDHLDQDGHNDGTFTTLVALQQHVRTVLANERDGAYEDAFGDGFDRG